MRVSSPHEKKLYTRRTPLDSSWYLHSNNPLWISIFLLLSMAVWEKHIETFAFCTTHTHLLSTSNIYKANRRKDTLIRPPLYCYMKYPMRMKVLLIANTSCSLLKRHESHINDKICICTYRACLRVFLLNTIEIRFSIPSSAPTTNVSQYTLALLHIQPIESEQITLSSFYSLLVHRCQSTDWIGRVERCHIERERGKTQGDLELPNSIDPPLCKIQHEWISWVLWNPFVFMFVSQVNFLSLGSYT